MKRRELLLGAPAGLFLPALTAAAGPGAEVLEALPGSGR